MHGTWGLCVIMNYNVLYFTERLHKQRRRHIPTTLSLDEQVRYVLTRRIPLYKWHRQHKLHVNYLLIIQVQTASLIHYYP